MSRLEKLEAQHWDPRLQAAIQPQNLSDLEQGLMRFFAHRPELALGMLPFSAALKTQRLLSDRLTELIRLRVAFFNQCRSCMAIRYSDAKSDGVTEDLVCSLERPADAENLSDADKAALHYAELMATDHLQVNDATFKRLREHFSEPEIVEMGMQIAFFVGFGRLAASIHMVEELPAEFQSDAQQLSPWGTTAVDVR